MRLVSLLFHDVYVNDPAESGFSSAAADRYKLSLTAFETQLAAIARTRKDAPVLGTDLVRDPGSGIRDPPDPGHSGHPDPGSRIPDPGFAPIPDPGSRIPDPGFAITVDDGGVSYHTIVADRLEALGWRGHCFVTTDMIGQRGFLTTRQIRELDARGHLIGSHSASHPKPFRACTIEDMRGEWMRSRQLLEDVLGHPVAVASLPGGDFSQEVARTASDAGIRVLFTSEPVTDVRRAGCAIAGRFTLRRRSSPDLAGRLVGAAPWARYRAWLTWNGKGLIKPVLGPSYIRVADWLFTDKPFARGVTK